MLDSRPPSGERAPDPARRSAAAHAAVLAAADALLAEVGYARLTIEAIAARAGVGKQTIYRWWPSKGAVVFDAFLARFETGGEAPDWPDTGDLERDVAAVLRATAEEFADPAFDAPFRALAADAQSDRAIGERLVEQLLRPQLEAARRRLRSAQQAGQVAPDVDLAVATELILGPLFHRWLLRTAPLTAAHADAVARLTARALRP